MISPCAYGTELAVCQRSSRRIAEEDGDDREMAGDCTEVEKAERRRQSRYEERGKTAEVHLAKWISV